MLSPIVLILLPGGIGGEQEDTSESEIHRGERSVCRDKAVDSAEQENDTESQAEIDVAHNLFLQS